MSEKMTARRVAGKSSSKITAKYLDRITDVNESILTKRNDEFKCGYFKFIPFTHQPYLSILHIQVFQWIDCLRNDYCRGDAKNYEENILALAARGADIDTPVRGIQVYLHGSIIRGMPAPAKPWEIFSWYDAWIKENDGIIRDLVERARATNPSHSVPQELQQQQQSLPSGMKDLLLKEELSDVKISCQDGTVYPAHVIILSNSSPFLKSYFVSRWSQVQKEGGSYRYDAETDSEIMKLLLTYMYTGNVGVSFVDMDTTKVKELLMAALMYEMDPLFEYCCCKVLTPRITLETIKEMTCTAHIIRRSKSSSSSQNKINNKLWMACTKFVFDNAVTLMSDTDFTTSLNNDHPDIWKDLQKELSQLNNNNKMDDNTNK